MTKNIFELSSDMIKNINFVSEFIDNKKIIPNYFGGITYDEYSNHIGSLISNNELNKKISKYEELYNRRINASSYMKVLFTIRKYQYYENPYEYPFSKDDFIVTAVNSKWHFINRAESLLYHLFKLSMNTEESAKEYIEENKIDLNINRIKLAYALKCLYNSIGKEDETTKLSSFVKTKRK